MLELWPIDPRALSPFRRSHKTNLGDSGPFCSSFRGPSPLVLDFTCSPCSITGPTWLLTPCLFQHSCLPYVLDDGMWSPRLNPWNSLRTVCTHTPHSPPCAFDLRVIVSPSDSACTLRGPTPPSLTHHPFFGLPILVPQRGWGEGNGQKERLKRQEGCKGQRGRYRNRKLIAGRCSPEGRGGKKNKEREP